MFDALSDYEKLKMPLLEDEETGRQFTLLIFRLLAGRSSRDPRLGKQFRRGGANVTDNNLKLPCRQRQ